MRRQAGVLRMGSPSPMQLDQASPEASAGPLSTSLYGLSLELEAMVTRAWLSTSVSRAFSAASKILNSRQARHFSYSSPSLHLKLWLV